MAKRHARPAPRRLTMSAPQRILCLVGIVDTIGSEDPMWSNWRKAFAQTHPHARVEVVHHFYFPWQRKRIHTYAQSILKQYDDGTPTLLFGYSMGGNVAHHVASHFTRTPVNGVYTVCTPLRLSRWLKLSRSHPHRSRSFAGIFDMIVPYPLSRVDDIPNHPLWVNHLTAFLVSPALCLKVARHIQKDLMAS